MYLSFYACLILLSVLQIHVWCHKGQKFLLFLKTNIIPVWLCTLLSTEGQIEHEHANGNIS